MRAVQVLIAAVILGLLGGYGWSAMAPRKTHMEIPKAAISIPPDAPETSSDKEWAARGEDKKPPMVEAGRADPTAVERSQYYETCDEARAAGKAPIRAGEPGYRPELDADGDGLACEPYRAK
jgi:excalibur calcium-binding domain-containing protein